MTDLTPTQTLDDELNMQNLEAELAAIPLDEVTRAIKDIADGRPVIVVDDADRENEGDIVFAASKATPELLAFTIRYGRGLICVPMLGPDLDRLNVPQMTSENQEHHGTAFTISVDARRGITTGISAADRANTIQLLASPDSTPSDLVRPGHVFPLRYAEGGVLRRRGHTEAAVDLAVLAGLPPVGVVCEVIGDDGTMLRLPGLRAFADEHGLALISVEQLIEHRRRTERLVTRVAETVIPNAYGRWSAYGYRSDVDGTEHLALVYGDLADGDGEDVLTRVHSECLTGDVFGSHRCDCGAQLDAAMAKIAEARPRRRPLPPRPRGPRHRPAVQAAGLRAPGHRRGHGRRQPRARLPGRRPRLLGRRPAPGRPRCPLGPAPHQQPGQGRRARRPRLRRHQDPAPPAAHPGQPPLPSHQARPPRPPNRLTAAAATHAAPTHAAPTHAATTSHFATATTAPAPRTRISAVAHRAHPPLALWPTAPNLLARWATALKPF